MKRLPESEEIIMSVIWGAEEPLDLKTIIALVNEINDKKWVAQTISTFLRRLRERGFLTVEKRSRVYYYIPTITKQEYIQHVYQTILDRFYQGDAQKMQENLQ